LPKTIACDIGRIMTKFSQIEYRLSQIIYLQLDLDPKRGRLAVREPPRIAERFDLVTDLMKLDGIGTDWKEIAKIRKRLVDAEKERDHLAHAVWLKPDKGNGYYTRQTKGDWPGFKKDDIRKKKRVFPELRSLIDLKAQIKELDDLNLLVFKLSSGIAVTLGTLRKRPR
jgi:hypothetical protein